VGGLLPRCTLRLSRFLVLPASVALCFLWRSRLACLTASVNRRLHFFPAASGAGGDAADVQSNIPSERSERSERSDRGSIEKVRERGDEEVEQGSEVGIGGGGLSVDLSGDEARGVQGALLRC
jgi:hypothetical protein